MRKEYALLVIEDGAPVHDGTHPVLANRYFYYEWDGCFARSGFPYLSVDWFAYHGAGVTSGQVISVDGIYEYFGSREPLFLHI